MLNSIYQSIPSLNWPTFSLWQKNDDNSLQTAILNENFSHLDLENGNLNQLATKPLENGELPIIYALKQGKSEAIQTLLNTQEANGVDYEIIANTDWQNLSFLDYCFILNKNPSFFSEDSWQSRYDGAPSKTLKEIQTQLEEDTKKVTEDYNIASLYQACLKNDLKYLSENLSLNTIKIINESKPHLIFCLAASCSIQTIKVLEDLGINFFIENDKGQTSAMYSAANSNQAACLYLEQKAENDGSSIDNYKKDHHKTSVASLLYYISTSKDPLKISTREGLYCITNLALGYLNAGHGFSNVNFESFMKEFDKLWITGSISQSLIKSALHITQSILSVSHLGLPQADSTVSKIASLAIIGKLYSWKKLPSIPFMLVHQLATDYIILKASYQGLKASYYNFSDRPIKAATRAFISSINGASAAHELTQLSKNIYQQLVSSNFFKSIYDTFTRISSSQKDTSYSFSSPRNSLRKKPEQKIDHIYSNYLEGYEKTPSAHNSELDQACHNPSVLDAVKKESYVEYVSKTLQNEKNNINKLLNRGKKIGQRELKERMNWIQGTLPSLKINLNRQILNLTTVFPGKADLRKIFKYGALHLHPDKVSNNVCPKNFSERAFVAFQRAHDYFKR